MGSPSSMTEVRLSLPCLIGFLPPGHFIIAAWRQPWIKSSSSKKQPETASGIPSLRSISDCPLLTTIKRGPVYLCCSRMIIFSSDRLPFWIYSPTWVIGPVLYPWANPSLWVQESNLHECCCSTNWTIPIFSGEGFEPPTDRLVINLPKAKQHITANWL